MEHTKGTWIAKIDEEFSNKYQGGANTRRYSIESKNCLIATVWAEGEFRKTKSPAQIEQNANACLIAAAPQMLDALHFVRGGINGESVLSEHLRVVDEAIEAAESIETLIERVNYEIRHKAKNQNHRVQFVIHCESEKQ